MKWRAWGRLVRLSLAPSAAADALAGAAIGSWGLLPSSAVLLLLVVGSLCVYHGGMALNDWVDREGDARTRPERPIPSGAIGGPAALRLAVFLLILGPLAVFPAAPAAAVSLAVAAVAATAYDLVGRGPWTGPALLALCRGMNLAAGVLTGAGLSAPQLPGMPRWALGACLLYAGYVFFASRLARLEDDEDGQALGRRPARALMLAAACLLALPLLPLLFRQPGMPFKLVDGLGFAETGSVMGTYISLPALALVCAGAWGLLRTAWLTGEWSRAQVGAATGMALRRLLIFTSACAWVSILPRLQSGRLVERGLTWAGVWVSLLILLGYPIALRLRRVFPPT